MSPAVIDVVDLNETNVRKWGTQLIAVGAYDAVVPDDLFGEDHLPVALPTGFHDLGFVTTDGVTMPDSITSEPTTMLQSLEPVRTDVTGRERSLAVVFGEGHAWTNALWHGVPVEDWPAVKDGPWDFTDGGDVADYPWLKILLYGQDGVGANAVYRVEAAYRAKVTSKTDRTLSRGTSENFGLTFGLYRDPVTQSVHRRAQDGPYYHPAP